MQSHRCGRPPPPRVSPPPTMQSHRCGRVLGSPPATHYHPHCHTAHASPPQLPATTLMLMPQHPYQPLLSCHSTPLAPPGPHVPWAATEFTHTDRLLGESWSKCSQSHQMLSLAGHLMIFSGDCSKEQGLYMASTSLPSRGLHARSARPE